MNKQQAASISILSNTVLVIVKGITGFITGSVSILSEALNSAIDIVASLMAYLSVREAEKPADREHPFGHGKFENLSGMVEAVLIIGAALFIVYEAISRVIHGKSISIPMVGITVMAFSAVVKFTVSRLLHKVAERTDSIALEAEARNLRMDVYSNLSVFAGLILIVLTGLTFIDSILAVIVAAMIVSEGVSIFRRSLWGLLDIALPEEELRIIHEVLDAHSDFIKDYHDLRTRKAGSERHIDLHLTVCRDESIADTHKTMDSIERELTQRLPRCKVVIHPEPCTHHSDVCPSECYWLRIKKGKTNTSP